MPEDEGRKIYTVAELSRDIKTILEGAFSSVWVEGEVSKFFVQPVSGHAYITIKDEQAVLNAVMWKSKRAYLKFEPKMGDLIVCRGRVSAYGKRSEYQLVVEAMEPKGLGALQAAFEQLKKKLAAEGLFDEKHKKPLPDIPWSVGLVTAPKGAAVRDMARTINRRFPGLRIVLAPVRVQGEGAAEEIAAAIKDFNEYGKVDVIIAGRGGGSLEDLWAFNEEVVARAIFASKIPVVSAVGHETDFTIADFTADVRASTPTAAAELVAPEKETVYRQIDDHARRLTVALRDMTEKYIRDVDELYARGRRAVESSNRELKERLNGAARHLGALSPMARLKERKTIAATLSRRLGRSAEKATKEKRKEARAFASRLFAFRPERVAAQLRGVLDKNLATLVDRTRALASIRRGRLETAAGRLNAVSPLAVLERGYSIVSSPDGKRVYRSIKTLKPGDRVRIRMADGHTGATISGDRSERQEKLF